MMKNKRGSVTIIILNLMVIFLIGYACWDYYQETNGQNASAAEFCRAHGYSVDNEINFFFEMSCYKLEEGIRTDYKVIKSADSIGEVYDSNYTYYFKERVLR